MLNMVLFVISLQDKSTITLHFLRLVLAINHIHQGYYTCPDSIIHMCGGAGGVGVEGRLKNG